MSGFVALCRKELLEQVRTFRLVILLVTFVVVGLASPLLAKLTPELVSRFAADDLGGMELVLTREPQVGDALMQYHGNVSLLPLLVILLAAGVISGEKSRRTAPMTLVKPVSRRAYLLSKAAVPAALTVAATALCAGACLLYTTVLFGEVDLAGFAQVNGMFLLALLFFLCLAVFASVLTPTPLASIGLAMGGFVLFSVAGSLPGVSVHTPGGLFAAAGGVILGREVDGLGWTVGVTVALSLVLLAAADRVLARQEL